MENNIYEVERGDYVGFVAQINPIARDIRESQNEGVKWIKIYSKSSGKLLCTREIYLETGEEHYYIIEFPPDEERIAAKPVCQITLETQEEVQELFNILSSMMKEKKNDRNI